MAITNPSFETAGTLPGDALGWTVVAASALSQSAEFDIPLGGAHSNKGAENIEARWRKRYTPRELSGNPADPNDWGLYDKGTTPVFTARGPVPGGGYLVGAVISLDQPAIAASDMTVAVTYAPAGAPPGTFVTASFTLPTGTPAGVEYAIALAAGDAGVEDIVDIMVTPTPTSGVFHVAGGLALAPYNEAAKFEFDPAPGVDLFPALFAGAVVERFEQGWDNDSGFKHDLDALPTQNADMDGDASEAFERTWKLPTTPLAPPYNEGRIIAFYPFVWTSELADTTTITLNNNDLVQFAFTAGGTSGVLTATIAPGTYTPVQLAVVVETAIGNALDADSGSATSMDFRAYDVGSRVYLENLLPGSGMIFYQPVDRSFWDVVGIEPGIETLRYSELDRVTPSVYGTIPIPGEGFEREWRSNENSKTAFVPSDLDEAVFVVHPSTQLYEPFNGADWILVL